MHHDLKIDQCCFEAVLDGRKRFAIRFNDNRGFQAGDTFTKHEISRRNGIETGRKVDGEITYVTNYFQREGYVVFGFKLNCDNEQSKEQP